MLIMTNGSVDQMERDIQTASRSVEEYHVLIVEVKIHKLFLHLIVQYQ